MTLLPIALGGTELVAWRLDQAVHAPTWDSGEGAYRVGGRWNSKGIHAVYCSLDPADSAATSLPYGCPSYSSGNLSGKPIGGDEKYVIFSARK